MPPAPPTVYVFNLWSFVYETIVLFKFDAGLLNTRITFFLIRVIETFVQHHGVHGVVLDHLDLKTFGWQILRWGFFER